MELQGFKIEIRVITRKHNGKIVKSEKPLQWLKRLFCGIPPIRLSEEIEQINRRVRRKENKENKLQKIRNEWWEIGWNTGFEIGRLMETHQKLIEENRKAA